LSEEKSLKLRELLEKGLYYYGLGENRMAVDLWKQVLELEPENELAREYLEIELETDVYPSTTPEFPRPDKSEAPKSTPVFTRGQKLIYEDKPAEAVESFAQAYDESSDQLYYWSYAELAKTSLIKLLLKQIGSFNRVPELTKPLAEMARMNFTEEQGFILSLITGDTSFEDVISLSPIPKYKTYLALYRFLEAGVIRIRKA
jgi:tetratricopeptide (TPR) repeat protein